jgi:4-carboxymuconolactone decarboxylase
MARVPVLKPEEMTDEQKRVDQEIGATRSGRAGGPFAIWLREPALADQANKFANYLRNETTLPKKLQEIAILVTARHWTAQYEWSVHQRRALEEGVHEDVVDAIRDRRRPGFDDDAEEMVYVVCSELYDTYALGEDTHDRAVELLGRQALIDLVAIAGFYSMIALTLNAFEVPTPEGGPPPLDD